METLISAVVGVLLGSGGMGLIFKLWIESSVKKYTENKERKTKENRAIIKLLLALSMTQLERDCRHYHQKGWVPVHVLRRLEDVYTAAKALGLNGTSEALWNNLCTLPNIEPKEVGK